MAKLKILFLLVIFMNNSHNGREKLIFKSKRFFPWVEVLTISILLLILIIPCIGLFFFNHERLSINDIFWFTVLIIIWLLVLIYFIFLFGENRIEIYENYIKIFPNWRDRLSYRQPIIIKNNNIELINSYYLFICIKLKNRISINNLKKYKRVSFSLSPSEKYNRRIIHKIFTNRFRDRYKKGK